MKKKTKKALFIILGVLVLIGTATGIFIAVDVGDGNVSGTILEEGSGNSDWKKYTVDIAYGEWCGEKFYTNMPGDYLTDIDFSLDRTKERLEIDYSNWFYLFDDFEAAFVLYNPETGNRYTTYVERSHFPFFRDKVSIDPTSLDSEYKNRSVSWYETYDTSVIEQYHIVEIWVRTVD